MQTAIETYTAKFGEIRTTTVGGIPYFSGTDVAKALGYKEPEKAVREHCKGVSKIDTPFKTAGGMQTVVFITEGDVYRLIVSSKLPEAEQFESWVFEEVLPSIRKNGLYVSLETVKNAAKNRADLKDLIAYYEQEITNALDMAANNRDCFRGIRADNDALLDAIRLTRTGIPIRYIPAYLRYKGLEITDDEFRASLVKSGHLTRRGLPTEKSKAYLYMIEPDSKEDIEKGNILTPRGFTYFVSRYKKSIERKAKEKEKEGS